MQNIEVNVLANNSIKIEATDVNYEDYEGSCKVNVIHVYDWYDIAEELTANCIIRNGKIVACAKLLEEKGFFLFSSLSFDNEVYILGHKNGEKVSILTAFLLGYNQCKTELELHNIYRNIIINREYVFSASKGDIETGNEVFDFYVFVKNLNISNRVQYGDIEVIPFNEYRALSETNMIDAFFSDENGKFDFSATLQGGFGAVIHMKNIHVASSAADAEAIAWKKAQILINLFSLTNRDNSEAIAMVAYNHRTGLYWIRVREPSYQGNLLRLADQGYSIRTKYKYLSSTETKMNAFIKLFNEAVNESERLSSYFKYWMLLGVMAESSGISGSDMKCWDGKTVTSKKDGKNVIISQELDMVFELVRRHNSDDKNENQFKIYSVTRAKDFLSICYQRRCCYAHKGGCEHLSGVGCNASKRPELLCKNNMVTVKSKYDDRILDTLESIVRSIIFKELEKVAPTKMDDSFVESLIFE